MSGTRLARAPGFIPIDWSAVAIPLAAPGDTNVHVLKTVTVPPVGPNGRCRVTALWRNDSNNGNNKTYRIRFGGPSGTLYFAGIVTTQLSLQTLTMIRNRNAENSQVGANSGSTGYGTNTSGPATSAVDWTQPVDVVFTVQLANGADSVALDDYLVEIMRAP